MKINEIQNFYQTTDRNVLLEHIAKNNDTGIKNEVLTVLVEQANAHDIWEDVTVNEILNDLRSWGYKSGS